MGDCDTAGYKQSRYDEIANEMRSMLAKVGWKKDFLESQVPYMPISGWCGDNLVKKTTNMAWWKGADVKVGSETIHCDTLYDCLDKMCRVPERPCDAPMRLPISGIYKIKGVGDVLAGRVEQGIVKPNEEVIFLPTHTAANACAGKVFQIEMHHKADVAMIMVPADGNFTTAIQRGNHKAGEIQGQTRQHARLINLLGVKQLVIGVNKMDCDTAGYKKDRFDEISAEMKNMLMKVGWKKDFIEKSVPVMPISGWMGDNLLKKSENMNWWKGVDIPVGKETIHVDTMYDVL